MCGMEKFIHIAVSMVSTSITGSSRLCMVRRRTRNTAAMATRLTLTVSAVIVSIMS